MNSNPAVRIWKERVEKGDKNIALSNVGHVASQQKYLLAMLGYLKEDDHYKNKKIGLVSFDLQVGLYKDFIGAHQMDHHSLVIPNTIGCDFIDWNYILRHDISHEDLKEYDFLLWDLPNLNFINTNSIQLQRFFKLFDSLLIVSLCPNGVDGEEHVKRIHNFYNNHGLKLPEIVNQQDSVSKPQKITDLIRKVVGF